MKGHPPILVVDDKWSNRALLVDLLTGLGFDVHEATNGEEALAKIGQINPQVIMTDLVMPQMDGFELIRQLRANPIFKETLIIALSASVFEEDEQKSLTAGSDAFVRKPIDALELFEILRQHLAVEWIYESVAEPKETHKRQNPKN